MVLCCSCGTRWGPQDLIYYTLEWEGFGTTKVLGEDVFRSPKPHPNVSLSLSLEQGIKLALQFPAHRAYLGSPSSLVSPVPGMALPSLTRSYCVR